MSTVRALADCFVGTPSGPRRLHGGEEVDAHDPLVRAHPALFSTPPAVESKRPVLDNVRRGKGSDA